MKQAILLIMPLFLLGGCAQEAEQFPGEGNRPEGATPLTVENAVLESGVVTRATTATLEKDGAQIGIFRAKATGYTDAQNNIPYKYTAGSTNAWAPSVASTPVWLLSGNVQVCAYYPYQSGHTTSTAIPLTTGLYTADGDISFAGNREMNGTPSKKITTFAMKRAMAKIRFTLKKGDYPGTCSVSKIKLANSNLPLTGVIDITGTNNVATAQTKGAFEYNPLSTGSLSAIAAGTATQEVLLIPFEIGTDGKLTVTLTVDTKNMQLDLPAATFTNSKIEPGKFYQLTVKLNGTKLEVTSVTIENWEDIQLTDGGSDYKPFPSS